MNTEYTILKEEIEKLHDISDLIDQRIKVLERYQKMDITYLESTPVRSVFNGSVNLYLLFNVEKDNRYI